MTDVLRLERVSAGYGRASVLEDISIRVGDGETVALLGPNGSGKSTVAKTTMGLTTLYSGDVELHGKTVNRTPPWKRSRLGLGYVPQVENVFRGLRVDENLLVGASNLPRREADERLDDVYALFPMLEARRNVVAGNLSGGERRLLAFATTLVQAPRLLVLDEPTSDLAPAAIDLVFEKIYEIRDQFKLPLLVIEQNVDRALELADRVCILVRGQVVVDSPAAEIDEAEIGRVFLQRAHVQEDANIAQNGRVLTDVEETRETGA